MSYNGWTNYETWAVALWIDNEQATYQTAREIVRAQGLIAVGKMPATAVAISDTGLDLKHLHNVLAHISISINF